jgi:hypothetical protein
MVTVSRAAAGEERLVILQGSLFFYHFRCGAQCSRKSALQSKEICSDFFLLERFSAPERFVIFAPKAGWPTLSILALRSR